ncbi:hypothetical protein TNCV_703541 [Trichonephila clavipes]|nr:hypothetical protein TNCV_703541 [Trichonephila clavipes]
MGNVPRNLKPPNHAKNVLKPSSPREEFSDFVFRSAATSRGRMKKLVIMALYRSPLTVTLWPSSFLKKYGPMIPPAHKTHQTVSFSGCNGVSTYTCGLASLQREFCLLT